MFAPPFGVALINMIQQALLVVIFRVIWQLCPLIMQLISSDSVNAIQNPVHWSVFPDTGDPYLPTLGQDIDIRTDVPKYKVFRDGDYQELVTDITDIWQDDFVTFVLGCSFSFEEALIEDGIEIRHITKGSTVPMFRSNIQSVPAGPFTGEYVVSMRPMKAKDAIRAIEITSRFPEAHGTPVHLGDPRQIGIQDISTPDFGDPITIESDEIPVFWACGVTPQVAISNAKPSICITHAPGYMLITDIPSANVGRGPDKF